MKKNNLEIRDLVYVHMNESSQYVISYGIEFAEFAVSLPRSLYNLLLLKHRFDDGELNRHTLLEYVPSEKIERLANDNIYSYGPFCWTDFEEVDGLNELSGQEMAELLYLGHKKQHLRLPFYQKLGNRYVYLSEDDGWFTKTYYRHLNDFYRMLSKVISLKLGDLKLEKTLLGVRKKKTYPSVNIEIILALSKLIREGIVISLKNITQNRLRIEIPLWVIGDFDSMDDMFDEYIHMNKTSCDAKLVFEKRTKEWSLLT